MAWWVVLGHVSLTLGWKLPLIDRNTLAVDVFIFLSGFVITSLVDRKHEAYRPYLIRRAFRIFPLYFVILLVSTATLPLALSAWSGIPFETSTNATRLDLTQIAIRHLPTHLAVHVPLLQGLVPSGLLPGAPYTIVGQAWSVSLEWQFYLIAPLMVWGLQTPRRAAFAVIAMVACTALSRDFSPAYLGAYIWHFGIGIASYMALKRSEARRLAFCLAALFAALIVYRGGAWQLIPLGIWLS